MAMKIVWFWKGPKLNNKWFAVENYTTDERDRPSTVESETRPTSAKAFSYSKLDNDQNLVVVLDDEQFDGCPELWYILEENSRPTDMVVLHAMAGGAFPNGTVVTVKDIKNMPMESPERVAFIRWFRQDSRIQQIFVSNGWRRKRVSTVLFSIADIVIISGEYGTYLNGGDITTADGEKLREAWSQSTRVTPRVGKVE